MKPDEAQFAIALLKAQEYKPYNNKIIPLEVAQTLNLNPKRSWFLLDKWGSKKWYDYGVSIDTGWLTPEGVAAFIKLAEAQEYL